MAQRTTYFVKAFSIPLELLVKTNQIKIHFVPTKGTRTWVEKGL
jgi:hypothetical protein